MKYLHSFIHYSSILFLVCDLECTICILVCLDFVLLFLLASVFLTSKVGMGELSYFIPVFIGLAFSLMPFLFIRQFDCLTHRRIFHINFHSALKRYRGVFMSIIFFQIVFYTYILMFYQWIYDSRLGGICWAISVDMPFYFSFITLCVWIRILFKLVIIFSTVLILLECMISWIVNGLKCSTFLTCR